MSKCIVCGRGIPFAFEIFCSFGCRNKAEQENEEILHDRPHKEVGRARAAKVHRVHKEKENEE